VKDLLLVCTFVPLGFIALYPVVSPISRFDIVVVSSATMNQKRCHERLPSLDFVSVFVKLAEPICFVSSGLLYPSYKLSVVW